MDYNPFDRGPHPAGVRSDEWVDATRNRSLTVEIWYPAHSRYVGEDLDPDTQDRFVPVWVDEVVVEAVDLVAQTAVRDAATARGTFNLLLLAHGWAGSRREATFLGTHLASHGYVVVAPDFPGSTFRDVDDAMADASAWSSVSHTLVAEQVAYRLVDVPFLLDQATRLLPVHGDDVGVTGASFGGWTSVIAPDVDGRVRATLPLCPAGGESPIHPNDDNPLRDAVRSLKPGQAAMLQIVADRDSWLPLYGQLEVFEHASEPKRMVILKRADHNHFVDNIAVGHEWLRQFTERLGELEPNGPWSCMAAGMAPVDQLVPEKTAYMTLRGLAVAHFDANLRRVPQARRLLDRGLCGTLAELGADVEIIERGFSIVR